MKQQDGETISTGVAGLDTVLEGGLTPNRIYLVEGHPGAGKTTLALQFLLEGVRNGEPALYMTLSESAHELDAVARSHGWSLDGIVVREYVLTTAAFEHEQVTMFHPSEVELGETLQRMLTDIDDFKPVRVVLDALSELRLLAETPIRYRQQLLAFKQFFLTRRCTVLLLDDASAAHGDLHVQSVLHGVVLLERMRATWGNERRHLRISKLRGRSYRSGQHDYEIRRGGLEVFPRLGAAPVRAARRARKPLPSGIERLDAMLGGGPRAGTSTLFMGAAGVGKTTIAMQYAISAAGRGEPAVVFSFDETVATLEARLAQIGLDPQPLVSAGRLSIHQVDPVEMSPGEFAARVCEAVERDGARVVVIDSLNGYLNAMPADRYLTAQLHELLAHLAAAGVVTLLVLGQHGLVGDNVHAPVDASYLADAIVLLRFFEAGGHVRKAIAVIKNRGGPHESTVRELSIGTEGIRVGEPLAAFRGVLTAVPEFLGDPRDLAVHGAPGLKA